VSFSSKDRHPVIDQYYLFSEKGIRCIKKLSDATVQPFKSDKNAAEYLKVVMYSLLLFWIYVLWSVQNRRNVQLPIWTMGQEFNQIRRIRGFPK